MKLATLCYLKDKGKTLMIHRSKKKNDYHKGKWNGLGGKLKAGETPEECVIREIKEESGLLIKNPQLVGFITFPLFDGTDDWYVFIYTASKFEGTQIDSPEGDLAWIDDNELLNLNLWQGDYIFMQWIKENRFFSAKFEYIDGKFKNHSVVFY